MTKLPDNPIETMFANQQELEDALHMVEDVLRPGLDRLALYFDAVHPRKLHYALFYRLAIGAAHEHISKEQLLIMIEAAYHDPRAKTTD